MDKYLEKILQDEIDMIEEELVRCRLRRKFLKKHNDLDTVVLMKGLDATLGVDELYQKIKSLELYLAFLQEVRKSG